MTVTLGELLKNKNIKQISVVRKLNEKYDLHISQGEFNRLCHKGGDWFGIRATVTRKLIEREYGIYYDGAVWRGGNYGN